MTLQLIPSILPAVDLRRTAAELLTKNLQQVYPPFVTNVRERT